MSKELEQVLERVATAIIRSPGGMALVNHVHVVDILTARLLPILEAGELMRTWLGDGVRSGELWDAALRKALTP